MRDYNTALARLRQFKQREMLRIAARDLARLANVAKLPANFRTSLMFVWIAVLHVVSSNSPNVWRAHYQDADGNWQPDDFCVLGLGKLGGRN